MPPNCTTRLESVSRFFKRVVFQYANPKADPDADRIQGVGDQTLAVGGEHHVTGANHVIAPVVGHVLEGEIVLLSVKHRNHENPAPDRKNVRNRGTVRNRENVRNRETRRRNDPNHAKRKQLKRQKKKNLKKRKSSRRRKKRRKRRRKRKQRN